MKHIFLTLIFVLGFSVSQANADIVCFNLGNFTTGFGTLQLRNGVTVDGSQHLSSGTMPAGMSFFLQAVASNTNGGGVVNNQAGGAGVDGAGSQAASGIDNGFNAANAGGDVNFSETLTFTISAVSGGTVVFDSFRTDFGTNLEFMNVNGGAPQMVGANTVFHPVAATSTLAVAATPFAVEASDNRFVVAELCFDIVPATVPEPGSLALLFSVGSCLLIRRRRS